MTVSVYCILAAFVILLVVFADLYVPMIQLFKKSPAAIESVPKPKLSDVAKHVRKEYLSLPEDSRPFPDIDSVLLGLDAATSHNATGRHEHFNSNGYMRQKYGDHHGYQFSWDGDHHQPCRSNHRICDFSAYYVLHVEIQELLRQIAMKERALNLSANADKVDQARNLVEALRQEREIQRQVTRELE